MKWEGIRKFVIASAGIIATAVLGFLDGLIEGFDVPADVYYTIWGITGTQNLGQAIVDVVKRPGPPAPEK
jgi:hypothetical protein